MRAADHGATTPSLPPVVAVSGGVAGVEAEWEATLALADVLDGAGDDAREWAVRGAAVAVDSDLLATAVWSPLTCAAAEAAVLRAATGPDGALGRAAAWELAAVAVRAAVAELVAADTVARQAVEARDYALGRLGAGVGLPLAVAIAPRVAPLWLALPPHLRARLGAVASSRLQQAATEHPGLVETAFNTGGGLVDGLLGSPPVRLGTPQGAAAVADLYDDGHAAVRERPDVRLPATSTRRPADLAGLVGALAGVARLSTGSTSPLNGTIAVATLRDSGRTRHVVYLPGTDDLTTRPWTQDGDVRDMGTNLALAAGRPTSYGAGVLQALEQAGVGRDEPVLLVGHSQGGMQAAALAAADTPYRITDVVTAGSPLAQVPEMPRGVQVLALENRGDVVPLVDGEPNRPRVGLVTATVDAGGEGVVGHHDHPRYVAGAAAVDASDDPSLRAAVGRLHDAGFLGDATADVETRVFQVTRE